MAEGHDRGLSRHRIRRQIETSLERLGIERIPLYMAHAPDSETPLEETLATFDELVREGKVGAVGASNYAADAARGGRRGLELEGLARYEWVQNSFSLLDRGDADTVFPLCHEQGLGYEVHCRHRRRLARRAATGVARSYPEGSRMTQRPEGYRAVRVDAMFDALEAFEREALGRGVSMAGLAIAWLLATPEVSAVVVGPTRAEQLEPVREAISLELAAEEHAHLGGLFP